MEYDNPTLDPYEASSRDRPGRRMARLMVVVFLVAVMVLPLTLGILTWFLG